MNSDWWQSVSPYLDELLDLDEAQREVWLENHPDLAPAMRVLLGQQRAMAAGGFLEQSPFTLPTDPGEAGQKAGAYTLLSRIGQGGMGTVWLAERNDGRFQRKAAVKFLNIELAGRGEERFLREGNLLGRLSHPNIAELLDAGINQHGQPYLVLEYVDGMHIDSYCASRTLSIEERILLFLDVAMAVAHAHGHLIVHRDLKPSNVLVSREGQIKLVDFGIAKWMEEEGRTEGTQTLTPEYAAPEQLKNESVTVATDVFMLGGLLYLMLTGQKPIGQGPHSSASLVAAIIYAEAPRMSEVLPILKGDLDTIAGKALKKLPSERYSSVTALADDLRRYMAHEPISARPDSLSYRASKFVRRNRVAVSLAGLAALAVIAGLIGTITEARRANIQRDFALRQLERAEAINDLNSFVLSDAAPSGKPFTVNQLLGRAEAIAQRQKGPGRLDLLISIGRQYWTQDEDAKARRVLEEAYGISRSPLAACALASSLARAGEQDRARALIREGLAGLPQQPQFLLDRVDCLARGSEVSRLQGASQEAIDRILEAQSLLRDSKLSSGLVQLRLATQLAEAYRVAGRHSEATDEFERANLALSALGRDNTQTAGTLLNNWALTLSQMGMPLEAEKKYLQAIQISKDGTGDSAVSPMLMLNYARALRELNRLPEAATFAERAYERAQSGELEVVLNQALILRCSIYRDSKDLGRAEEMLAEVEPRLRKSLPEGHMAFASIAVEAALNAQAAGDLAKAQELLDRSHSIATASIAAGRQGADFIPPLLVRRSRLALLQHRDAEAVKDAARAVTLLQAAIPKDRMSSSLGRAYLALGFSLEAQGKTAEAAAAKQLAAQHLAIALGPEHADTLAAQSQ